MSQTDYAAHIKTVFCDLDGCVFKHHGDIAEILANPCELLPGAKDSFKKWGHKGYTVILTTGRPESMRSITEQQVRDAGLYYHHLIMDLPRGQRVVINDVKPGRKADTAACVNVERNKGMENVDI
ncbi:MAG: hypothetical protein DRJ03_00265 [Chloroflexi bacterium]|nr:MAG: hypothetical protein DRJ03_00265 [Chloroflexota bacterium]